MIKNIVFDIGDVLVDFRWLNYMKEDLAFSSEVIKIFTSKIIMDNVWDEWNRGDITDQQVYEQMLANVPGYEAELNIFWKELKTIVAVFPYTDEWLGSLKKRGYGIYLLSNYPASMFDMHAKEMFHFLRYTDGRIISGHEKLIKPEAEIYQLLLSKYELEPSECVFLDDREENIAMAKSLGMKGIVVTEHEAAAEELEKMLVME